MNFVHIVETKLTNRARLVKDSDFRDGESTSDKSR
jgi:hypothetical protein